MSLKKNSHLELEDHETPFNMAMLFYLQLSELMKRKNDASIHNEWGLAIECLEEIFTLISFRISDEEYKYIENKIKKLKQINILQNLPQQIKETMFETMKNDFRNINREIMKLLNKYNMIFPKIDNVSRIEKMKERYGLTQ